jgi:hypothetical protein
VNVEIKITDTITKDINKRLGNLDSLSKEAHQEYVNLTPVDKGNARRKTTLKGKTIQANYPYATRLDEGWSKQAPKGMTEPFEKWLQDRVNKILGR